ncbi:hypothetical protein P3X46_023420 [Hevea brasiliensis]|uniref:DUF7792 domain-containing protein n=1 Tax=Hevea brasiliensis TaxID=3981 RepID=A0ABQ9LB03_HEVBR|nr:uncharacterized protein LOC110658876 [Hevea brasiliensis]KAJ9163788.1 hypothetical protein P3X46_023420 [Hevea brasiliensis]
MAVAATVSSREEEKTLQELTIPILLADRVINSAQEAESFKQDCSDLAKQVERLSQLLRSTVRLVSTTPSIYDRPLRLIASDISKNLDRALTLVRKCKHSGVLRHVFSIISTADFRKVSNLLESSIGDMKWLLSIFESDGGTYLSLPPIACNDPILAWVWSHISTIQMGQPKDRVDAANELASLARDSDRNKKMIVKEGGILPCLKLLKEGPSPEAQIAAANALFNIATDQERVRLIVVCLGVPIIVGVLGDSPMKVQIVVANLVASMAELDPYAQEEFMRETVNRPLVSLLSIDLDLDVAKNQSAKTSIHSLVQMNKELSYNNIRYNNGHSSDGNSHHRKEREMETPEVRLKLKVSCALALWKLSKGSVSNSRKITETKGLLCLAKIIEHEKGELQLNCLMTVSEIVAVAESNDDLRRAAFKTNWPPAKAVLNQLLRVIQEESDPKLQIPAIRSIGCLARTFPARETRIIAPLVAQLGNRNVDVATEVAISLGKFVSPDNFNCSQHSKAIIEFDGVQPLMKLIRNGDRARMHGLVLLCYLALNSGNSKALEQVRALNALEGAARPVIAQHPELRDLLAKAIHHLTLYQAGAHPHRQSFAS